MSPPNFIFFLSKETFGNSFRTPIQGLHGSVFPPSKLNFYAPHPQHIAVNFRHKMNQYILHKFCLQKDWEKRKKTSSLLFQSNKTDWLLHSWPNTQWCWQCGATARDALLASRARSHGDESNGKETAGPLSSLREGTYIVTYRRQSGCQATSESSTTNKISIIWGTSLAWKCSKMTCLFEPCREERKPIP